MVCEPSPLARRDIQLMSHTVLLGACSVKERLSSWVSYCLISHILVQGRPLGERVEKLLQTAAHVAFRDARFCSARIGEVYEDVVVHDTAIRGHL